MVHSFLHGKKIQPSALKRIKGGGKRFSDVAPVLIGGMMVGGAAAIASMKGCGTAQDCPTAHLTCGNLQVKADCLAGTCSYSCV
jgi:hypothetical protein